MFKGGGEKATWSCDALSSLTSSFQCVISAYFCAGVICDVVIYPWVIFFTVAHPLTGENEGLHHNFACCDTMSLAFRSCGGSRTPDNTKKIASTATSRCSISGASEKTQLKMPHGSCFLVQILLIVPGPFFSPVKSNLWRCSHVTSKIPRSFDLFILYLQIIR